jgi:hypothetical protein
MYIMYIYKVVLPLALVGAVIGGRINIFVFMIIVIITIKV